MTPSRALTLALSLGGVLLIPLGGCGGAGSAQTPAPPLPDAVLTLDNRAATVNAAPVVNRRLLGSNLQWTNQGDGIYNGNTLDFEPLGLAAAQTLSPTVLRYPGGALADAYHYAQGIGATRGTCLDVWAKAQATVHLGTDEFLDLCQRTGAAPMITLNVITGSPAESAAWVNYANGTPVAGAEPLVRDWEVGNEPYYHSTDYPAFDVSPAQFATAYDAHAKAVLAADGRVRVGLPLLGPNLVRLVPEDRKTFNATVLGSIQQRVDFVAVHDAYLPFLYQASTPSSEEMLRSVLASAPAVAADLTTLRAQLGTAGISAPFAMTEHNALMSVGFGLPYDGIPASVAGALYTADLICTLAARDDVDSAEHWSLIGNWYFGAMYVGGLPRPAYRALQGLGEVFKGRRIPLQLTAPVADIPAFGALPAQTSMPLVSGFVTGSGGQVRVILVNRSTTRALRLQVACGAGAVAGSTATLRILNAADPLLAYDRGVGTPDWVTSQLAVDAKGLSLDLPAHALAILTLEASTGTVP